ncbi:uncharacterized protein NDAI_0H03480 [Naumovozyma dairenensis CBS 421]|uniref:Uncharacterized protein n=1 Tax=Naumovozyma dairenensis (strain ATCC 10597 / BCRC 20456 / CBS 421 / NBRC 0211 / NRRL Y-12639) TaxID=1071378 RepID=G0WFG0_NAUDC|nr:hypothetical protein NDAI_0H03480 [Naumovozyma dairenensis CBS 421]CCD26521.1 hypothetical protein NDAI_0H03480 [Naumovozyma dairenensis CBS 421]
MAHEKQPLLPTYEREEQRNNYRDVGKSVKRKLLGVIARYLFIVIVTLLFAFLVVQLSTRDYLEHSTFEVTSLYPTGLTKDNDIRFSCSMRIKFNNNFEYDGERKFDNFINEKFVKELKIRLNKGKIYNAPATHHHENNIHGEHGEGLLGAIYVDDQPPLVLSGSNYQTVKFHGIIKPENDNLWDTIKHFRKTNIWIFADITLIRSLKFWESFPLVRHGRVYIKI